MEAAWKNPSKPKKLWENRHFLYNFITFLVIFFSMLKYIKSQKQWEWSLLSDTFSAVPAPDLGCLGTSLCFHFYAHVCNPCRQLHAGLDCRGWASSPTQGSQHVGDASPAFLSLISALIWISHFWKADLNLCGDLNSQDAPNWSFSGVSYPTPPDLKDIRLLLVS